MANSKNSKNAKTEEKIKSENINIDIKDDLKQKENKSDMEAAAMSDNKSEENLDRQVDDLVQKAQDIMEQEQKIRSETVTQAEATGSETEVQSNEMQNNNQTVIARAVESQTPLEVRTVVKEKSYSGVIFGSLMLITAAFGYLSYDFFNKINNLNMQMSATESLRSSLDSAKITLQDNMKQIDLLKTQNLNLAALNASLTEQNKELNAKVESLAKTQNESLEASKTIIARLDKYEDRDPYAWRIAEAYFMSKQAFHKAIIAADVKSALWYLREADGLLANIQDKNILNLRKVMSEDIVALSNIKDVDRSGMSFTMNALFNNVDNLVIKGYLSAKTAQSQDNLQKSGNVADWKTNLLTSAKEFSSKFIEVRRRSGEEITEFLSPQQDLFVRENIKTRITLALSDLANMQGEAFKSNLETARDLVKAYFEAESQVTVSMIAELDKLIASEIKPNVPETLQSYIVFEKIYNKKQAK